MRYFQIHEFDSPDLAGSGSNMDSTLLSMLDNARAIAGVPFVINSGYRTQRHNTNVGGTANSSHLRGLAVDIACPNASDYFTILEALIQVGFTRLGFSKTFIHADIDTSKNQRRGWGY